MCVRAMYAFPVPSFLPFLHVGLFIAHVCQLIALLRPVQLLLNSFTTRGKEALIVSR